MTATAAAAPPAQVLAHLRELADRCERFTPGVAAVGPFTVHYTDALSLYMEYKDIFCNRIYHFETENRAPRIIDGGGCIGMSVLYFKSIYPGAEITCFEPDPASFAVLERNMSENGIRGVRLIRAGLARTRVRRRFRPDGADGGRIVDGPGDVAIETEVLSAHLDRPVDLVKLNIEGQEWAVLAEAAAAGRLRNAGRLIVEYHGWADGEQRLGAILNLLDKQGFRYLVHDFDAETCAASKPPFQISRSRDWFCLVAAERLGTGPSAPRGGRDTPPAHRRAPVSRVFGLDRGRPIDRHFIETFLDRCRADIRGRVLEIGDDHYTRQYGGDRVDRADVLHAVEGNPKATLVGDLTTGAGIPADAYDCIILTQTLQHVFEVRAAIANTQRALKPGGVLLATVPGISQISRYDMDRWGDFWRFTSLSVRRLLETAFPADALVVETHGNVALATAFLEGMAVEDLGPGDLEHRDPDYELLITVRATRPDRDC